ncbi:serine hydrolase domain-containing protein [Yoonia sp. 2307UL14-13]|uniref:serine hydrolase domain-containing protein n=1 Tax=Yoonia sp. 2307UL14-13 TaxID=3126506 RepID=UPI00309FE508
MNTDALDELARSLTGPFAFCGIGVAFGEQRSMTLATADGIKADQDTMFRAASISKVIVGQAVAQLVNEDLIQWHEDLSDILGIQFGDFAFGDIPLTASALASHTSGMTDDGGYLIPPDQTLSDWCAGRDVFDHQRSGEHHYCNLGYIILAQLLEDLCQAPFPDIVADLLPQNAGFNWHGVSQINRANRLPTYRRGPHGLIAQIDEEIAPIAAGIHPGVYSPQGGLRVSMRGLLDIAEGIRNADLTVLWQSTYGAHSGYGAGLMFENESVGYPHPIIGHFANAYGFRGGVWFDETRDLSFAYALNGFPIGDESDDLVPEEHRIFQAIADLQVP